jgi:hypothetical protein
MDLRLLAESITKRASVTLNQQTGATATRDAIAIDHQGDKQLDSAGCSRSVKRACDHLRKYFTLAADDDPTR